MKVTRPSMLKHDKHQPSPPKPPKIHAKFTEFQIRFLVLVLKPDFSDVVFDELPRPTWASLSVKRYLIALTQVNLDV